MSNTPEFTTEQLAAARSKAWHQNSEPLLTLDAVRDWITASGLVLFAPRTQQLAAPAPSLVEATLGASSGGPTPQQLDIARSYVARLTAEGNALPLNLLGVPATGAGHTPDFIVSAQVFSYVFTLRGDKAWKQPPSTSGASKISPLGLRIYEALTEKGALSASELANELGREVTEAAILRALNELWSALRVIPLLPQGDEAKNPTLWELTSRRFTKAIKAGVNAGQPTALSALISLYLAQALLATEEEVEAFLSPLAARSRIREVLHALSGSRQLETIVLEGKSLLHIPGTLPEFPVIAKPEPTEEELAAATAAATPSLEGEGRIKKFTGAHVRKTLSDFKGKPARTFGSKASGARVAKPRFAGKSDHPFSPRPDSERRPFRRDASDGAAAKPSFSKPWSEDRKPRAPRAEAEGAPAKRPYVRREEPVPGAGFVKRPYTPRESSAPGGGFAKRPYVRREASTGAEVAPAKRPYTPRESSAPGAGFAKRPYVRREAAADGAGAPTKRPYVRREGSAPGAGFTKRPYTPREGGSGDRPAHPSFGAKPFGAKPFGAKRSFGDKPAFSKPRSPAPDGERSAPRPRFDKDGAIKPFKPFPRREGSGPTDFKPRAKRTFGEKPARDSFSKFRKPEPESRKPAGPTYGGSDSKPREPKRPFPRKEGDLADRPVRPWPESKPRSSGPRGDRPSGPPRDKFGAKPGGSFRPAGGKVPFGGKPGFGKRPAGPGRPKPGGFKPVRRKPESEE